MNQDINLYLKLKKPRPGIPMLSWRQYWYANNIFVALLLIVYALYQINFKHLSNKFDILNKQYNHLKTEFHTIKKNYPALFFSENVEKSLEALQEKLKAKEKLLKSISSQTPISAYLNALSASINENTWLTEINIQNIEKQIILKGKSSNIYSIKQFLESLVKSKFFSSYVLNVNNIDESQASSKPIDFEIVMVKRPL